MSHTPSVTLVVATYNWPKALLCCLKSIARQQTLPREVLIADDGSKDETKELVQSLQKKFPVPLVHIWHADEGFQLSKIRNKAMAAAKGEYIIQIDGDLILHPHFIADHLELAEVGYFITGSRRLLNPEITNQILDSSEEELPITFLKSRNFFNGLRSSILRRFLSRRYKITGKNKYYVKGCNMSFWKKDLLLVNGYNETFKGWGREDSDIAIRLMNYGIRKQFLKMGGIVYHLYHKEANRDNEQRNTAMMEEAIRNKFTRCEKGMDQYI